jgi:ADP-ribose pyrophosphatase YjhB (NUDIX family)
VAQILPIVITILECENRYLFLKRRKEPYANLWSLVGGKVDAGEHIRAAAVREIMEETGASQVADYKFKGMVSERLVGPTGSLISHFLIFVGRARIDEYHPHNREGDLSLFTKDDINSGRYPFLPSDRRMFDCFQGQASLPEIHEAEMVQDNGYHLTYYRKSEW